MDEDAAMMETVNYGGWPNCIRLYNGEIELVATTDVGPRVIRLGFIGGQNLFKTYPESLGRVGDPEWQIYGGHRLWHAPEVSTRTYSPDNSPVEHSWDGATLLLRNSDEPNGIDKEIRLTISPTLPRVEVAHRLINRNPWPVELAPWALSVMAPGGRAIFPQEEFRPHPDVLVPARPLVLWYFADMSDPRWTWGRRYIQLRQDSTATTKQKAGLLNKKGWAAYLLGGEAFVVRYAYDPDATYTDMGCNTETYTDPKMLEVETLGPLTRLEPGEGVDHLESWLLAKVECGPSDAEIDAQILPLVGEPSR
ncbi:MAG: hypothetical protein ABSE58_11510 [Candidatus Limnocylindrales bacterium]|jgi:hypothetical protein